MGLFEKDLSLEFIKNKSNWCVIDIFWKFSKKFTSFFSVSDFKRLNVWRVLFKCVLMPKLLKAYTTEKEEWKWQFLPRASPILDWCETWKEYNNSSLTTPRQGWLSHPLPHTGRFVLSLKLFFFLCQIHLKGKLWPKRNYVSTYID